MQNPLDWLSARTGIVLVDDWLRHPVDPNVLTLRVPGYRQTNTFACGFAAAATVVRYYYPRRSLNRLHELVEPDPESGTSTARLKAALRASRVAVREHDDLKWRDIYRAINQGWPVIVTVATRRADTLHWCVIYGVGRKPNRVFIAGQGLPWFGGKAHRYHEFRLGLWHPVGNGLICRRAK
jgi:hypothetical protein